MFVCAQWWLTTVYTITQYHGFSTRGAFYVRYGDAMPPSRYATGDAVWEDSYYIRQFDINGDGLFHTYYVPL